jgi:Family of unknown function (DUF6210)
VNDIALIRLYEFIGVGLIIIAKSGVRYTNQTGGHCCCQPEVEGFFVPLRNDLTLDPVMLLGPEPDLYAYFTGPKYEGYGAISGLDVEDAFEINKILAKHGLARVLTVDSKRLKDSHEAWVYVSITDEDEGIAPSFSGFGPYPRSGVLTWTNSD